MEHRTAICCLFYMIGTQKWGEKKSKFYKLTRFRNHYTNNFAALGAFWVFSFLLKECLHVESEVSEKVEDGRANTVRD